MTRPNATSASVTRIRILDVAVLVVACARRAQKNDIAGLRLVVGVPHGALERRVERVVETALPERGGELGGGLADEMDGADVRADGAGERPKALALQRA